MLLIQTVFAILLPAVAHVRRQQPFWLFAYGIIAYACLAVTAYLSDTDLWQSGSVADTAFHDTYYVVAHVHYAASIAFILCTLLALHFAQFRFARVPQPRLLVGLFWALHLALVFTLLANRWLLSFWTPRELSGHPQVFAWFNGLQSLASLIGLICVIGMIYLLILSVWRRMVQ